MLRLTCRTLEQNNGVSFVPPNCTCTVYIPSCSVRLILLDESRGRPIRIPSIPSTSTRALICFENGISTKPYFWGLSGPFELLMTSRKTQFKFYGYPVAHVFNVQSFIIYVPYIRNVKLVESTGQ